ncbi:MAG: CDP-alcohol phosphatidyltransferase family protein [Deltaproteobacteria bacterium]|nr:CDP-alcohol phosphatidyltransferase family protein [Deltaproteobacteria bacterium]
MTQSGNGSHGSLIVTLDEWGMQPVAGVTVFERLVRAFEGAGGRCVAVLAPESRQDEVRPSAERLGCLVLSLDSDLSHIEGIGPWVFVSSNVVVDRGFFDALLRDAQQANLPVSYGQDGVEVFEDSEDRGLKVPSVRQRPQAGSFVVLKGRRDRFRAKRALIRACRKPMEIDGLICTTMGRPLSGWITHVLVDLPVTPNMVTALSLLFGLLGAVLVGFGGYGSMVAGAAVMFLSWVLDNCDGEIARTKYMGSTNGAWFDIYADFVTNVAFLVAMAVGLYRATGQWLYLPLGGYAALVMSLYNVVVFRFIHRLGIPDEFLFSWWFDREDSSEDRGAGSSGPDDAVVASEPSPLATFFSYVKYLGRRDFFIFAYLVLAILGRMDIGLWATAIGATFTGILTVIHLAVTRNDSDGQSSPGPDLHNAGR